MREVQPSFFRSLVAACRGPSCNEFTEAVRCGLSSQAPGAKAVARARGAATTAEAPEPPPSSRHQGLGIRCQLVLQQHPRPLDCLMAIGRPLRLGALIASRCLRIVSLVGGLCRPCSCCLLLLWPTWMTRWSFPYEGLRLCRGEACKPPWATNLSTFWIPLQGQGA